MAIKPQGRVHYIDGLRGVAILLVILTHYWGLGFPEILPFGDKYGSIPIIAKGWVGVQLFFLISGYVIFLTIERCDRWSEFILKRWLRLFPAMFSATIITIFFNYTFQPVPRFINSPLIDILPGITFIAPSFFHMVTGLDVHSLHNAFWTLYVEVGFYVVFAALYFRVGWKGATFGLVLISLFCLVGPTLTSQIKFLPLMQRIWEPTDWLGMRFYLWFASGILFAKADRLESRPLFVLALLTGLVAAVIVKLGIFPLVLQDRTAMVLAVGLFASALKWNLLQRVLEWRPLLFVGVVSYPLYLIHETIGLGLIVLTYQFVPSLPSAVLPVFALAMMTFVAYLISRYIEPPLRRFLGRRLTQKYGAVSVGQQNLL